MNTMTLALREAGAKLPTIKYRIWHWLKDHPEKTNEEIQKALGLSYVPAVDIRAMERDKQLKVYSDVSKKINPVTGHAQKIKRYSVTNKDEYEPPLRKKHVKKSSAPAPLTIADVSFKGQAAPLVTSEFDPEKFVSKLTLKDVKALYVYLHGVFK